MPAQSKSMAATTSTSYCGWSTCPTLSTVTMGMLASLARWAATTAPCWLKENMPNPSTPWVIRESMLSTSFCTSYSLLSTTVSIPRICPAQRNPSSARLYQVSGPGLTYP